MNKHCGALVPPSTYVRSLRPCSKWANLRRFGKLWLCPHHRVQFEARARMEGR